MRITPQQLQIKLASLKPTVKGEVGLKSGETFKAQVISILTDALVLQTDTGELLRANVADLSRFVEGDQLKFQVVDSEGEQVKVEIVKEHSIKSLEQVKLQLETVDLRPTEENVKAFDVLKSLDMNVTKANIEVLTKNVKLLSVLHENVDKILNSLPDAETTLKSTSVKSPTEVLAKNLGYSSETEMKEADLKEVVVKLLNKMPQEGHTVKKLPQETLRTKASQVDVEAKKMPAETLKQVFGLIRKAMSDDLDVKNTFEKVGQLLKMNKPITIRNFSMLDKLSSEGEKIGDQVKELMGQLNKDQTMPKLLSLLKGFDIKKFTSDGEVKTYFNELLNELEGAKTHLSSRVKSSAAQLVSSLTFIEKNQAEVSWIQLPIQMNQTTENLDLYFKHDKKESKSLSKDNAKILIALDTKYLDLVQAFVQIKGRSLDVGFAVENDGVKGLFENNLTKLEKLFEDDFEHIKMHVSNKKPMTYSDFVYEDNSGHINITV